MENSKSLDRIKDRVEYLLAKYPHTQDCDKSLWLGYLVEYHDANNVVDNCEHPWQGFVNLMKSKNVCSIESVRRVRQKLQESGKYLGTKKAMRMEHAVAVRDWARNKKG